MEVEDHVRGSTETDTNDEGVSLPQHPRKEPMHYDGDKLLEASRRLQKMVEREPRHSQIHSDNESSQNNENAVKSFPRDSGSPNDQFAQAVSVFVEFSRTL